MTTLTWEDFYSLQRFGMTPDLSNILRFCEKLGHPETSFPSIHIGGTNGKGSVTAIVDSILRSSGYRVGRYTSPHILHFEERIQVDGKAIPELTVLDFLAKHWDYIKANRCTFFEVATAMAMDYFRKERVEVAVVEVGLGGRYDATRVVDSILSIITRIDYDHMDRLGDSLKQIAKEKAGIFRLGIPALTYHQHPEVLAVLTESTQETGSLLHKAEDLVSLASLTYTSRHLSGKATLKRDRKPLVLKRWLCPLTGDFQAYNIRLAIAACSLLSERFPQIHPDSIVKGLNSVSWPGRLQELRRRPALIVDVGHNPGAIQTALASLHKIWKARKVHIIFSALRDKDVPGMIAHLKKETGAAFVVPLPPPRGLTVEEISDQVRKAGWEAQPCQNVEEALQLALNQADPKDVILAIGSHYLAEEVLKIQNIT